MTRRVPQRAKVVAKLVLPAVLGLAALTGCGAGALTQTAQQAAAVNGFQGRAGTIDVRDAHIAFAGQANTGAVYRAGQTADLVLTLVNVGSTEDKLLSVSSASAASAEIQGEAVIPAGRAVQVGNDDAGPGTPVLADRTISIKLTGLKQDIKPGLKYPVTFTFQKGGVLNAELPVGYPTGALGERK